MVWLRFRGAPGLSAGLALLARWRCRLCIRTAGRGRAQYHLVTSASQPLGGLGASNRVGVGDTQRCAQVSPPSQHVTVDGRRGELPLELGESLGVSQSLERTHDLGYRCRHGQRLASRLVTRSPPRSPARNRRRSRGCLRELELAGLSDSEREAFHASARLGDAVDEAEQHDLERFERRVGRGFKVTGQRLRQRPAVERIGMSSRSLDSRVPALELVLVRVDHSRADAAKRRRCIPVAAGHVDLELLAGLHEQVDDERDRDHHGTHDEKQRDRATHRTQDTAEGHHRPASSNRSRTTTRRRRIASGLRAAGSR